MKNAIFVSTLFAILLFATSVMAAPKVGDQASMEGGIVKDGVTTVVTTVQTIVAYEMSTGRYTIRQVKTVGGNAQTTDQKVLIDDFMSKDTAAQIVAACESAGIGTNEKIQVKAGKFNTCQVKSNGGTLWIGSVPFGVVRIKTRDADGLIDMALSSFEHGTK